MTTVLITDDSATARMFVQRCMEVVGGSQYTYLHAQNGQEAMELIAVNEIDLIITDIVMPIMDGKSLLKRIKASPRLNHIPVFVISSLASPVLEKELSQIGVNKLIYKPVSPPKLLEALKSIWEKDF